MQKSSRITITVDWRRRGQRVSQTSEHPMATTPATTGTATEKTVAGPDGLKIVARPTMPPLSTTSPTTMRV